MLRKGPKKKLQNVTLEHPVGDYQDGGDHGVVDYRATWGQALWALALPILIILTLRWVFFEPYVIPSGSMIPNLLIYDHVLVNKFSYGIRLPFSSTYLFQWRKPKRGDIIVFRYPQDPNIFYVKRVVAVPGDVIRWSGHSLFINGEGLSQEPQGDGLYREGNWLIQFQRQNKNEHGMYELGSDEYFVMGDHRDHSSDSRVWGPVKLNLVLGTVSLIWLSCEEILDPSLRLCDPQTIRWNRIGIIPR
ncbi:MAG: signal peptidase I [Bdellovibrionaceae bacterium]|nr:signal peptidase I [Pseudobdellovibrionaceae bacterium]MDW8191155.1 signal peptidase I [Pseudobdellovibrionaceae bacterium]